MATQGESSQPRSLFLEQTHEIRRDNATIALQDQIRRLTMELEWAKGFKHRAPHCQEFDHNPIDIAYFSSHKDHEEQGVRGRGPFRDDISGLKIEASESDGNLKPKNYINGFKPFRGSLSSKNTMTRKPLSWLFSS